MNVVPPKVAVIWLAQLLPVLIVADLLVDLDPDGLVESDLLLVLAPVLVVLDALQKVLGVVLGGDEVLAALLRLLGERLERVADRGQGVLDVVSVVGHRIDRAEQRFGLGGGIDLLQALPR